jgi:hypothetical protein
MKVDDRGGKQMSKTVTNSVWLSPRLRGLRLITAAMTASISLAHGQSEGAAKPPPEVKKTVDAFVGHWVLTGTDQEPSSEEPVHFKLTIDCRRASLGAAVSCLIAGRLPGVGPVEAAAVIGYSPDEQQVRWMEISSTGEYHDHKGRWNGDTIEFEPLLYSISGRQATEHLSIRFPSVGQQVLRSVTVTSEGKAILEWSGKRTKLISK